MQDRITQYLFTTILDQLKARQDILTRKVERGLRRPVTLVHLVRTRPDGYKYPFLIATAGESETVKAYNEYLDYVEQSRVDYQCWKPLTPPRPPGPWERWQMTEPEAVIHSFDVGPIAPVTPIESISPETIKKMAEDIKIRYPNHYTQPEHFNNQFEGLRAWADECPYLKDWPKPNDKD